MLTRELQWVGVAGAQPAGTSISWAISPQFDRLSRRGILPWGRRELSRWNEDAEQG